MALGRNTTCILAGNNTVWCWGAMRVPERYASATFVAIETDGDAVCDIMHDDQLFRRVLGVATIMESCTMPGACVPRTN
jgi:hypothetical protein